MLSFRHAGCLFGAASCVRIGGGEETHTRSRAPRVRGVGLSRCAPILPRDIRSSCFGGCCRCCSLLLLLLLAAPSNPLRTLSPSLCARAGAAREFYGRETHLAALRCAEWKISRLFFFSPVSFFFPSFSSLSLSLFLSPLLSRSLALFRADLVEC